MTPEGASNRGEEISIHRVEAARQSRGLTTSLGGTCVAIFTFLLFFLYPRFALGEVDPYLFQASLVAILGSLFLLVFAAWFYFIFTQTLDMDEVRPGRFLIWADLCFAVAVVVLTAVPSLVLLTVGLQALGFLALAAWSVYLVVFVLSIRQIAAGRRARAGTP